MTSRINSGNMIRRITFLGIMTAMVILLQILGSFIRFGPFSISLVLVPIVIGAAIGGVFGGAWLGGVFGLAVLISGDAATFLAIHPIGTVITVMAKGILCGVAAALVYKLMHKKQQDIGVILAAIFCPVVNTGVFLLGGIVFFLETIRSWALAEGMNLITYLFVGLVGGNFIAELIINILLCPVILRLLDLLPKIKS